MLEALPNTGVHIFLVFFFNLSLIQPKTQTWNAKLTCFDHLQSVTKNDTFLAYVSEHQKVKRLKSRTEARWKLQFRMYWEECVLHVLMLVP